jgi:hypothetical protein
MPFEVLDEEEEALEVVTDGARNWIKIKTKKKR